jgi:hypothetical protein
MWQDTVIAICQLSFLPAMLPSILGKDKPAFSTSLMNMLIVSTIVFCLATLHLWFSTATGVVNASAWTVLAFQTWRQSNKRRA